jgi:hypothetical protein
MGELQKNKKGNHLIPFCLKDHFHWSFYLNSFKSLFYEVLGSFLINPPSLLVKEELLRAGPLNSGQ